MRGAWIEIESFQRNLKLLFGRSPCGERGLKYAFSSSKFTKVRQSLPVRGAWIEIR